MGLRDYQQIAIDELKRKANSLLELQGNKTIIFEAPTGSGKTVMIAEFLKEFIEGREDDKRFSFIWAAPRQLHTQSKERLERYYFDSKALKCSSFEDLADKRIGEHEILFLNWESINREDNIYIRDNEKDFNLSKIIENTCDEGRNIVLIIDESHHAAATTTSRGLIQMFQPRLSIEVSATPELQGDEKVKVHREKVIDEGMIKKRISLNPGFKNILEKRKIGAIGVTSNASESTNEFVIGCAVKKWAELQKAFESVGSNVNPLMLIQLPDRRQGVEDVKDEVMQILKNNHGMTIENGRLAIYLSENKENLDNITKNDSPVEVMIFKQAIALGWDCPRASILVLFRDWKSITFSVQTVGRILRMPELKHYENDELNMGFVYTNLDDISIQEDIAGSYLTVYSSSRKDIYKPIALRSVHSKRFREETRLTPQFIRDFLDAAKELELNKRITLDVTEIESQLITDGIITDPDKAFEHLQKKELFDAHSGDTVRRRQTEKEVQLLFDLFARDALAPFAPEKRSIGRVKDSIYRFLSYEYPVTFEYGGIKGQMVVLYSKNRQHFIDAINKAKEIYLSKIKKDKKELVIDEAWEVPLFANYNNEYTQRVASLSILEPFYESNSASGPEKEFVMYLDSKTEIEWWYKNGQRDGSNFAVPYREKGEEKPFYVDWIVKYKDGRTSLFDTKAGITAETAKTRAEGLAKYIKEENSKGKGLFGGIVIKKDGSWRYNDKEVYEYDEKDLSGWKFL